MTPPAVPNTTPAIESDAKRAVLKSPLASRHTDNFWSFRYFISSSIRSNIVNVLHLRFSVHVTLTVVPDLFSGADASGFCSSAGVSCGVVGVDDSLSGAVGGVDCICSFTHPVNALIDFP